MWEEGKWSGIDCLRILAHSKKIRMHLQTVGKMDTHTSNSLLFQ